MEQLHIKYRPNTLNKYGDNKIIELINKQFNNNNYKSSNLILIHGESGCGKTTLARILSKRYLCLNRHKDGSSCEECGTCKYINDLIYNRELSTYDNLIEIDAITANTKNKLESIIKYTMELSIYQQKVLIFDECQMLTNDAQNKIIELIKNIHDNVVVIFITTDTTKLLPELINICKLNIAVTKPEEQYMLDKLSQISKIENITVNNETLLNIIKNSDGIPRSCINTLQHLANAYNNNITMDAVNNYHNNIDLEGY